MENLKENTVSMIFAAIDKSVIQDIPKLEEIEGRGNDFISWGENNLAPEFLFDLYKNVTTLSTIIEALSDYATGENARCNINGFEKQMNRRGDSIEDIIK